MDWKKVKEGVRGGGAPELPPGRHLVKIVRVGTCYKDGRPLVNDKGIPQIVATLSNHEGEVSYFAPLAGEQVWKFENLIAAVCSDADLDQMTTAGLNPTNFMADAICRTYLLNRSLVIVGKRKGDFVNWNVSAAPAGTFTAPAGDHDGDIPF